MATKNKQGTLKILTEAELRKKYGAVARKASEGTVEQLFLPCRSLVINDQLGGGAAYGRIMELIGYESTGKSLLALDFCYVAQSLGGAVLWDDAEGTFNNAWAIKNGVDPKSVDLYEENDIEGASDWMRDMVIYHRSRLTQNQPIILVVDSIAAWECAENINSDQKDGKAEMGNRAKAIYKLYRKRNNFFKRYGVVVIPINQVREKVGASMFEDSQTTPGGAATKFYASQRLVLVRSKQIKVIQLKSGKFKITDKASVGKKIGQNIITQIKKNKIAAPKGSLKTSVYFTDEFKGYLGFDRYKGLADILLDEKIIKRKGGNYYFKGERIAKSEEEFENLIETDDTLRRRLVKRSSINTASKLRERLDSLPNLYPVKLKAKKEEDATDE